MKNWQFLPLPDWILRAHINSYVMIWKNIPTGKNLKINRLKITASSVGMGLKL